MDGWEVAIRTLGSRAYDHLYNTDAWFRKLSDQVLDISGIIFFFLPEECYAHFLHKRFREIQDPFITVDQLSIMLKSCSYYGKEDKQRLICDLYRKHFPEESACSTPRTLLHLSRCSIRKRLKSNRKLPAGIQQLHIPAILRDYLNLKS